VPTLQIQPRPCLRFVERLPMFDEAFLPALILMLVNRTAEKVEPRDARQDSDEPGSTAAATLEINTFGLGVEGRLQASPFAVLVGAEFSSSKA
jgi:hypothetical protein